MNNENSFIKTAGMIAVIIGILYLVIGVNYLFIPEAQKEYLRPEFWPSFAQQPLFGNIQSVAFALIAFFAIGIVPLITKTVGGGKSGFLSWMMYLGMIGFAVHGVEEIRTMALATRLANAYVNGDAAAKSAVAAIGLQHVDPLHIFKFGFVGLWIFIVNLKGLTKKSLPSILAIIGIIGAFAFWLDLVGNVFQAVPLITAAAIVAIILGPVWYIWMGVVLRRSE